MPRVARKDLVEIRKERLYRYARNQENQTNRIAMTSIVLQWTTSYFYMEKQTENESVRQRQ